MADEREFNGLPKQVVGDIARDTTNRPSNLRLKAQEHIKWERTAGTNGERKSNTKRVRG